MYHYGIFEDLKIQGFIQNIFILLLSYILRGVQPQTDSEKNKKMRERKIYLNHNVKTLIRIAETYSENGKMPLSEFKDLAQEEEIIEKKYYAHFNQACRLGYLKRVADEVYFIMGYD